MAADGAFTVDEVKTGSASLTSFDRAFLESPPDYEERDAFPEDAQRFLPWVPSAERRAAARRLFVIIGGSAVLVLVLALLRLLWQTLFPS